MSKDESTTTKRAGKGKETAENEPCKTSSHPNQQEIVHASLFDSAEKLDVKLTELLAVCANEDSVLYSFRWILVLLEISCHGVPWILGILIGILVSHQQWVHEVLLNLLAVMILDLVVVGFLKVVVRRQRPALNKMDMFLTVSVDQFSYPSGHTTRAVTTAIFFISYLTLGPSTQFALMFWSFCVALSRVMLGRHHVFDVACGAIIGFLQCYLFIHYLWISEKRCESIIRPLQEELHL